MDRPRERPKGFVQGAVDGFECDEDEIDEQEDVAAFAWANQPGT
jgi:hypothetical protein